MTQNIYDDAGFFQNYSQLPRSVHGLDGAAEWGSLRKLLPPLRDLRVLDLGCGFGWFCRWVAEQGARSVLGVDVSQQMLARARAQTQSPAISYQKADLEAFVPQPGTSISPIARSPSTISAISPDCSGACMRRSCPAARWSARSSIR